MGFRVGSWGQGFGGRDKGDFLSSFSQQRFSLPSSFSQQLFSAVLGAGTRGLSQQPFAALSQRPFSAITSAIILLCSGVGGQLSSFSSTIILLRSGVGGQLVTSSCCAQGLVVRC